MSFLQFQEVPKTTGKTKDWSVVSTSGGYLGEVKWYSAWRRYAFMPQDGTVFDAACLQELFTFLSSETNKQKETWK